MTTLYDKDFCEWSLSQAQHLRNKEIEQLDFENLIEEIEFLARKDKRSLNSILVRLMMHLLKMQFAIEQKGNSNSWNSSIYYSRKDLKKLLKESPSLKNEMKEMYEECYTEAKEEASRETLIPDFEFPCECPWTIEEILQEKK